LKVESLKLVGKGCIPSPAPKRVICSIAIGKSLLERSEQVRLFGESTLDLCIGRLPGLTPGRSAQVLLIVGNMRYLLAKAAHVRRRLEPVLRLSHFLRGPNEIVSYVFVIFLDVRAQRIALCVQRRSSPDRGVSCLNLQGITLPLDVSRLLRL
jgi:hypothetical protein